MTMPVVHVYLCSNKISIEFIKKKNNCLKLNLKGSDAEWKCDKLGGLLILSTV